MYSAEQNIAKLFAAAFTPGFLAALGYMMAIAIYVRLNPDDATVAERQSYINRFKSLLTSWPVIVIFALVIGGIYLGVFTPTEAAAVEAFGTGILALLRRRLTWHTFGSSILNTARATAMIFLIVLGAELLNRFLAVSRMPHFLADSISGWQIAPSIMIALLIIYVLLGCVLDSLSMILLSVPIVFPIVMGLDFGLTPEQTAIWFGILTLVVVEVELITPPVGLNVFIINALAKDVPMIESFAAFCLYSPPTSSALRCLLLSRRSRLSRSGGFPR